jgi:23S rRNA (cytosine1962-C5)-methyltransferase
MYRMVFSESDYLPGLIIDRYNDCFAIQISSAGMELKKDLIVKALLELYPDTKGIIEKNLSQIRKLEGLETFENVIYGNIPDEIICSENGIILSVSLIDSQKTGYFLDQRDNRNFIQKIANDLNVLDCYSNQGGFALNALKGGAKSVTAIDVSQPALDKILKNMQLNNFHNYEIVNSDVSDYLQKIRNSENNFDMIILDPPAFTKSKKTLHTAIAGYRKINKLALENLSKNGFLVSSSCSHHLLEDRFFELIINEASRLGRNMTLVFRGMQALDHPVHLSMPESQYLKFFVFQMKN